MSDGKMTPSVCAKLWFAKESKEVCDLSRLKKYVPMMDVFISLIKEKHISSTNYPDLIDKLYRHYFGIQKFPLKISLKYGWIGEETALPKNKKRENRFIWNSLLKDTELAKQPLKEIQVLDYINFFFRHITKEPEH